MAIIPAIICLGSNALLCYCVRSPSRRVEANTAPHTSQQRRISRRDIHVLQHMVVMFSVLLSGFLPMLILRIVSYYNKVSFRVECGFGLWAQVALLIDMIDLYLYNHGVRKYLIGLCRRE
jgi:hypothetical protein